MSSTGTLVVRVVTSLAQLPVSDATVTVLMRNGSEAPRLLSISKTDSNGKTAPLVLKTPDTHNCLVPAKHVAYALYEVWIEHPNFCMANIRNVPIYSDIESIQEVNLRPLSRSKTNDYCAVNAKEIPLLDL